MQRTRMDHLSEVVLLHRRRLGMTQAELAKAIGVNQFLISHIETAKCPRVNSDVLMGLSAVFRLSVDYLLGLTHGPPSGVKPLPGQVLVG